MVYDPQQMIQTVWDRLPKRYPGVYTDTVVVMPNHIHGIILLFVGATPRGCPPPCNYLDLRGQARGGTCPYICGDGQDQRA